MEIPTLGQLANGFILERGGKSSVTHGTPPTTVLAFLDVSAISGQNPEHILAESDGPMLKHGLQEIHSAIYFHLADLNLYPDSLQSTHTKA